MKMHFLLLRLSAGGRGQHDSTLGVPVKVQLTFLGIFLLLSLYITLRVWWEIRKDKLRANANRSIR